MERENELLRQQLDESLQANEELTRLMAQLQRNPPWRPKKKSSRRTQVVDTETPTVQTEAQARSSPRTHQAARAADETQTQAPELPEPQ